MKVRGRGRRWIGSRGSGRGRRRISSRVRGGRRMAGRKGVWGMGMIRITHRRLRILWKLTGSSSALLNSSFLIWRGIMARVLSRGPIIIFLMHY